MIKILLDGKLRFKKKRYPQALNGRQHSCLTQLNSVYCKEAHPPPMGSFLIRKVCAKLRLIAVDTSLAFWKSIDGSLLPWL